MNVLIHIDITDTADFVYEKPIISWGKNEFKDLITFDIDNHSDSTLIKYAANLIENEDKAVIYINVKNETGAGKMLGLAETIIKNKIKCLVFQTGESKIFNKMFSLLKENYSKELNIIEVRNKINQFLNA